VIVVQDTHVLVVEDEPYAAETTAGILEDKGYRLHFARDGIAALECTNGPVFRRDFLEPAR